MGFTIFGQHDDNTLSQFELALNSGSGYSGVLCADGHYGYGHPIGGVVGYTDHISISGVGYDIACGNMAVKTDVLRSELIGMEQTLLNEISSTVSFGVGRNNNKPVDHDIFYKDDLWKQAGVEDLKDMARAQLGTVGSGNHYVDLFEGDDGYVWIGVHFGSRGLGHKITTKYLRAVGATDRMDAPPALLEAYSELGLGYRAGIELGGLYAYAGREWVVNQVLNILACDDLFTVHNHHNFMWEEEHFGQKMFVVRKGATPAFPGQYGFVGGSMGENAVILRGVDSEMAKKAMYSTVHGAGRTMSRGQARRTILQEDWDKWMTDAGVTVMGGDLDESPQAYRRLPEVLEAHAATIEIMETLKPFAVIMASKKVKDPYKD